MRAAAIQQRAMELRAMHAAVIECGGLRPALALVMLGMYGRAARGAVAEGGEFEDLHTVEMLLQGMGHKGLVTRRACDEQYEITEAGRALVDGPLQLLTR